MGKAFRFFIVLVVCGQASPLAAGPPEKLLKVIVNPRTRSIYTVVRASENMDGSLPSNATEWITIRAFSSSGDPKAGFNHGRPLTLVHSATSDFAWVTDTATALSDGSIVLAGRRAVGTSEGSIQSIYLAAISPSGTSLPVFKKNDQALHEAAITLTGGALPSRSFKVGAVASYRNNILVAATQNEGAGTRNIQFSRVQDGALVENFDEPLLGSLNFTIDSLNILPDGRLAVAGSYADSSHIQKHSGRRSSPHLYQNIYQPDRDSFVWEEPTEDIVKAIEDGTLNGPDLKVSHSGGANLHTLNDESLIVGSKKKMVNPTTGTPLFISRIHSDKVFGPIDAEQSLAASFPGTQRQRLSPHVGPAGLGSFMLGLFDETSGRLAVGTVNASTGKLQRSAVLSCFDSFEGLRRPRQ